MMKSKDHSGKISEGVVDVICIASKEVVDGGSINRRDKENIKLGIDLFGIVAKLAIRIIGFLLFLMIIAVIVFIAIISS